MDVGILSYGCYVPRRRLQRDAIYQANKWYAPGLGGLAKGEKAISNWDEDPVTMAVEAGRYCLDGIDRSLIDSISLASTTLPFADRSNAGIVKEALNLSDQVMSADQTGSLRAATGSLMQSLTMGSNALCLAADRRKSKVASVEEMNYGDASAAVLTGSGEVIAKYLGGYSKTIDFVDHYRETGADFDYAWEARFVRDEGYQKILGAAISSALDRLQISGDSIAHALISVPVRGVPQKLAAVAGIAAGAVADTHMATVGDTGVSHPMLMLALTLQNAKPGEKVLLASFGQGADVLVFETTEHLNTVNQRQAELMQPGLPDSNYSRYLFHRGLLDIDKGMRAELDEKQPGTSLARDRKTVLGLIGGKCNETGVVQFPKTALPVNTTSRTVGTFEDYPLADRCARVISFTADRLAYSPDPPSYYGMIDFEGGGRMVAEFADIEEGEAEVGRKMRMVFRIKAFDELRGFRKYFWKAIPAQRGQS
ncbi:MAG: OB-fold domain-containing protein [Porticoccaceae bacterium]|nr:OB-fold domain-containing protein [Porticoccaceae bacterium]